MAVLLVRHAAAGDRDAWDAPDQLRPLDGHGLAQAESLVDLLAGFPVERVLSSPYLRCTQTVEPLAAARGLEVEPCEELAEGGAAAALVLVRRLLEGPGVVLCTHGDVMEAVLDGRGVSRTRETEKGATWAVEPGAARYLPPPE